MAELVKVVVDAMGGDLAPVEMCIRDRSWIILQNNQNHRKCDSKVKNTRRY